jgi:hypothetical protein
VFSLIDPIGMVVAFRSLADTQLFQKRNDGGRMDLGQKFSV